MKPCPNCGATGAQIKPVIRVFNRPNHDIAICGDCGLFFKPQPLEARQRDLANVYTSQSWNVRNTYHKLRLNYVAHAVQKHGTSLPDDPILDIGAGTGILYDELMAIAPRNKYFALEPSDDCVAHLTQHKPNVEVIKGAIDNAVLRPNYFKYVFVCGVDYLFDDVGAAFNKIHDSLREDGIVIGNRNVFVDMPEKSFPGSKPPFEKMFAGNNPLFTNWFHSQQYLEFLGTTFQFIAGEQLDQPVAEVPDMKIVSMLYFLRKRADYRNAPITITPKRNPTNYVAQNMAIIDKLFADGPSEMAYRIDVK